MIRLLQNQGLQQVYVSPYQAKKYLSTFTHYLIEFKGMANEKYYRLILNVTTDNKRFTKCVIGTDVDDAVNGSLKMEESGFYTFKIYGQNSATNLDPDDASIVGVCQRGLMQIIGDEAWTIPSINIPNNVVYYE